MTPAEWEALCDRCGKCCVLKLEDSDTGEIHYTDVACRLLDCGNASCTNYPDRKRYVPDCITLSPDNLESLPWMPESCAYRLLHEGKSLSAWHPLLSGDADSTRKAASLEEVERRVGSLERDLEREVAGLAERQAQLLRLLQAAAGARAEAAAVDA